MHKSAKVQSTGQIEVDGRSYRVVERPEEGGYDVLRDADGVLMGSFALPGAGGITSEYEVLNGAKDPELVREVARLLASPRGLLPIQ